MEENLKKERKERRKKKVCGAGKAAGRRPTSTDSQTPEVAPWQSVPVSPSEAESDKHRIGAPCDPYLSFWKDGTAFSLFGRHPSITGKWAINNEQSALLSFRC